MAESQRVNKEARSRVHEDNVYNKFAYNRKQGNRSKLRNGHQNGFVF